MRSRDVIAGPWLVDVEIDSFASDTQLEAAGLL
jgi:hypothetical protein